MNAQERQLYHDQLDLILNTMPDRSEKVDGEDLVTLNHIVLMVEMVLDGGVDSYYVYLNVDEDGTLIADPDGVQENLL